MAALPACNSADSLPPVLAVVVVDMGTVEVVKTLHSTQEELAGSQQAESRDMTSLIP